MTDKTTNDSMLELYLFESTTMLEALEELLDEAESRGAITPPDIAEIFRLVHTLKGSANMMSFDVISDMTHRTEDLCTVAKDSGIHDVWSESLVRQLKGILGFLKDEIRRIQEDEPLIAAPLSLVTGIDGLIEKFRNGPGQPGPVYEAEGLAGRPVGAMRLDRPIDAGRYGRPEDPSHGERPEGKGRNQRPGSAEHTYFLHVYFNKGAMMENIRAYILIDKLGEAGSVNRTIPADPENNAAASEMIIDDGLYISYTTGMRREQLDSFMKGGLSVESVTYLQSMPEGRFADMAEKPTHAPARPAPMKQAAGRADRLPLWMEPADTGPEGPINNNEASEESLQSQWAWPDAAEEKTSPGQKSLPQWDGQGDAGIGDADETTDSQQWATHGGQDGPGHGGEAGRAIRQRPRPPRWAGANKPPKVAKVYRPPKWLSHDSQTADEAAEESAEQWAAAERSEADTISRPPEDGDAAAAENKARAGNGHHADRMAESKEAAENSQPSHAGPGGQADGEAEAADRALSDGDASNADKISASAGAITIGKPPWKTGPDAYSRIARASKPSKRNKADRAPIIKAGSDRPASDRPYTAGRDSNAPHWARVDSPASDAAGSENGSQQWAKVESTENEKPAETEKRLEPAEPAKTPETGAPAMTSEGTEPAKMPEAGAPAMASEGTEPAKTPEAGATAMSSEGTEPANTPETGAPAMASEGTEPANTPEKSDPTNMPEKAEAANKPGPARKEAGKPTVPKDKEDKARINRAWDQHISVLKHKPNHISVEIGKLDALMDIADEISVMEGLTRQHHEKFAPGQYGSDDGRELARLARELKASVMSIRMTTMDSAFQRMQRIVGSMGKHMDKEVKLIQRGGRTVLDKSILDALNDPLMHLVRNAMDHGIEPKDERIAAGKDPVGTITLSAKKSGIDVLISVEDDGRGIPTELIRSSAKASDLPEKPLESYSGEEVFEMISAPGLSTAKAVTEFSGRGVGLDVVKANVYSLDGSVSMESAEGKGTKAVMRIPVTVSVEDCLEAMVCNEICYIPAMDVDEVVELASSRIKLDPGNDRIALLDGSSYPIVDLAEVLCPEAAHIWADESVVLLTGQGDSRCCVLADGILGKKQATVRPIPKYLRQFPLKQRGIYGCAITEKGTISLVIDIQDVI